MVYHEKMDFLCALFNKHGKTTFYKIVHEKKRCLVLISTSREPFKNIIIERAFHIHESYHKKERILRIYKSDGIKIYSFSVLNLIRNKLRLNNVSWERSGSLSKMNDISWK